jgi:lipid II:glycine glycyltransferase (peptidoglycan interpeptide bridge formation enzyme)
MNGTDDTVTARRIEGFERHHKPGERARSEEEVTQSEMAGASSFMQSAFWAVFKSRTGFRAFECDVVAGREHGVLYVLVKTLKAHLAFCYVPHGPENVPAGFQPHEYLERLGDAVSRALREHVSQRILFVRFDLAWDLDDPIAIQLSQSLDPPATPGKSTSKKSTRLARGTPVQVPDTVLLPLQKDAEDLLASMKPKWRYNIRLAEKKGVRVTREGQEALDTFQNLYRETAKRDEIAIHEANYYKELFATGEEYKAQGSIPFDLSVWTARYEGEPLAAIITLFFGKHATYLYGASSNERRNLMPAYALQWNAILAAKEAGCVDYDFFGIPPNDDPNHPMAGLYFFKTGFGGRIVHRVGSIDYSEVPVLYELFRSAERVRLYWYKSIKKLFRKQKNRLSGNPSR